MLFKISVLCSEDSKASVALAPSIVAPELPPNPLEMRLTTGSRTESSKLASGTTDQT
jgi:hypothetical protein